MFAFVPSNFGKQRINVPRARKSACSAILLQFLLLGNIFLLLLFLFARCILSMDKAGKNECTKNTTSWLVKAKFGYDVVLGMNKRQQKKNFRNQMILDFMANSMQNVESVT